MTLDHQPTPLDVTMSPNEVCEVLGQIRDGEFDAYCYLLLRCELGANHEDAFRFASRLSLVGNTGKLERLDKDLLIHVIRNRGVTMSEVIEASDVIFEKYGKQGVIPTDPLTYYLMLRRNNVSHRDALPL